MYVCIYVYVGVGVGVGVCVYRCFVAGILHAGGCIVLWRPDATRAVIEP